MKNRATAAGVGMAVCWAMVGCGGSGRSSPSQATPTVMLTRPPNTVSSIPAAVTDSGQILGSSLIGDGSNREVATIWRTPSHPEVIPNLTASTDIETITAVSPDGNLVAGSAWTGFDQSGPMPAFVYSETTKSIHTLVFSGLQTAQVAISSVEDDGTVHGTVTSASGFSRLGNAFVYDLSNDTYTLASISNPPSDLGTPTNANSRSTIATSANGAYATGYCTFGPSRIDAVWNIATRQVRFLDSATPITGNGSITFSKVSNDGLVAAGYGNAPSDQVQCWVSVDGTLKSLTKLVKAAGFGSNWTFLNNIVVSPGGKYVACNGMISGNYTDGVILTVK